VSIDLGVAAVVLLLTLEAVVGCIEAFMSIAIKVEARVFKLLGDASI